MYILKRQTHKITGFLPVLGAIIGNILVTVIKFIGFFISGSGAMFSEAIHSVADVSNQILLMVGIKRSVKKADSGFSYGYGRERFFWALISACGIFFLGAGATISHGIQALIKQEAVHISSLIFQILIVAFIIESVTLLLAVKSLISSSQDKGLRHLLKHGDPSTIAVIYEDGVAVLGVIIAFVSIALTSATKHYYWDAFGSIVIGLLLGLVAVSLILKNRSYLIGRDMPRELQEEIIEIFNAEPTIEKVLDFKSTTLDVGKYRIKCEVEFNSSVLLKEVELREEFENIKNDYGEFIKFCVDHTDRMARIMGNKIDEIEKKIHEQAPCVKHIDIEIN